MIHQEQPKLHRGPVAQPPIFLSLCSYQWLFLPRVFQPLAFSQPLRLSQLPRRRLASIQPPKSLQPLQLQRQSLCSSSKDNMSIHIADKLLLIAPCSAVSRNVFRKEAQAFSGGSVQLNVNFKLKKNVCSLLPSSP